MKTKIDHLPEFCHCSHVETIRNSFPLLEIDVHDVFPGPQEDWGRSDENHSIRTFLIITSFEFWADGNES